MVEPGPWWDALFTGSEFGPVPKVVGVHFSQTLKEAGGMVPFSEMAELMDDDMSHQVRGEEQQPVVEIDPGPSGTTPPTGELATHPDPVDGQAQLLRQLQHERGKSPPRLITQPQTEYLPYQSALLDLAADFQAALAMLLQSDFGEVFDPIPDGENLAGGKKLYRLR